MSKESTNHEYKISVLLPTRGRSEALTRSLKSLFELASDTSSIELLLGFDNDDKKGLESFQEITQPWLDSQDISYTVMSFEPLGYSRLNEYVNTLASTSDSDWLIFWNDDAVMETENWDGIISSYTGQFKLLAFHTHNDHPYSIFPIVPRAWLDTLGYLSPHQLSDGWLSQQAYLLDIWERIPVNVTHDRYDLTGNNLDDTFKNRVMFEGNHTDPRDFHNKKQIDLRYQDCDRLAEYMKQQGLNTSWWENVKNNKQDPWEKLKLVDVNKQMMQYNIDHTGSKK